MLSLQEAEREAPGLEGTVLLSSDLRSCPYNSQQIPVVRVTCDMVVAGIAEEYTMYFHRKTTIALKYLRSLSYNVFWIFMSLENNTWSLNMYGH